MDWFNAHFSEPSLKMFSNELRAVVGANHALYRDSVYYYVRRVPYDLTFHYDVKRLYFSLKTKSASAATRASKSIN